MLKLRRVFEEKAKEVAIDWVNPDVQDEVEKVIKGLEVDKDKTTKDKLIFKFNDKNGSLHLQGYMLVLDMDTDDDIPAVNYPVKDRNHLSVKNLLDSVKVVFTRRQEAMELKEKEIKEEQKEETTDIKVEEVTEKTESTDNKETVEENKEVKEEQKEEIVEEKNVNLDLLARERLVDDLSKCLIVAPACEGRCDEEKCKDLVWLYLSPSYALNQLSDIRIPVCLDGNMLSMKLCDIPDPQAVFGGSLDKSMNPMLDYNHAVQDYLLNDAPESELMDLNIDNVDDAKARIVDVVNSMAEDYQTKKTNLEEVLDLDDSVILNESRYYIVPASADPSKGFDPKGLIEQKGFTDLGMAKVAMSDMASSGKFDYDLRILDTHYSNNRDKWEIL